MSLRTGLAVLGLAFASILVLPVHVEAQRQSVSSWKSISPYTFASEARLEVRLKLEGAALRLTKLAVKPGKAPKVAQVENMSEAFTVQVLGRNKDILHTGKFELPTIPACSPPLPGEKARYLHVQDGTIAVQKFSLTVPYLKGSKTLVIRDKQGRRILRRDLLNAPEVIKPVSYRTFSDGKLSTQVLSDGIIDITFLGAEYGTDQVKFIADADRMRAALASIEPFASRISQFRFNVVDVGYSGSLGCYRSPTMDRLLICDNAKVTSAVNASGVPYDKIVVIVNSDAYGGSGGNIAVTYRGTDWGTSVFVHEFAHSFAGLMDEYVLYPSNAPWTGVNKNCFVGNPPASAWSAIASVGYEAGCNYANALNPGSSLMGYINIFRFNDVSVSIINQTIDSLAGRLGEPTPTPRPTATATATPTVTNTPTSTPTATPTSVQPTPVPTSTPTVVATATPQATATPTSTPTPKPTRPGKGQKSR